MSNQSSSYKSIFKATSILGGVQMFQILIGLIKVKFIAVFIGTIGMGISGLLTSTMSIVTALATLGLNYGAVRELSIASHENDIEKLNRIYTIFSRWLYYSSILGVIIVILFSSIFSKYTFGNQDYRWAFIWLSITVFFDVFTQRNNTILQGTSRVRELAMSSVLCSGLGLIASIPLYYFFGVKGIVPALIISAITGFFLSYFFSNKLNLVKYKLSLKQVIFEGRDILNLGIIMMIALFMGRIVIFSVNAFISYMGSISDVGLYNAGMGITSQSIGLIFTAMSLDYFPRLCSISSDNKKLCEMVNQQSEVILLIVLPISLALMLFAPLMIRILLTPEFANLVSFIRLIALGTAFQAASSTIGMIFLAKGDKKNYLFINAFFANVLGLILFNVGYYFYGLNGLAIAIGIHHLVFFIIYILFTKKTYNYSMSGQFRSTLMVSSCITALVFVILLIYPNFFGYFVSGVLFVLAIAYSLSNLNKLIGLNVYCHSILNRIKK